MSTSMGGGGTSDIWFTRQRSFHSQQQSSHHSQLGATPGGHGRHQTFSVSSTSASAAASGATPGSAHGSSQRRIPFYHTMSMYATTQTDDNCNSAPTSQLTQNSFSRKYSTIKIINSDLYKLLPHLVQIKAKKYHIFSILAVCYTYFRKSWLISGRYAIVRKIKNVPFANFSNTCTIDKVIKHEIRIPCRKCAKPQSKSELSKRRRGSCGKNCLILFFKYLKEEFRSTSISL